MITRVVKGVTVSIGDNALIMDLYVIDKIPGNYRILIGLDFLTPMQGMIDYGSMTLVFPRDEDGDRLRAVGAMGKGVGGDIVTQLIESNMQDDAAIRKKLKEISNSIPKSLRARFMEITSEYVDVFRQRSTPMAVTPAVVEFDESAKPIRHQPRILAPLQREVMHEEIYQGRP